MTCECGSIMRTWDLEFRVVTHWTITFSSIYLIHVFLYTQVSFIWLKVEMINRGFTETS